MKVCVVQPAYSFNENDRDNCFKGLCDLLDQCDESLDLIVLPEYSDNLVDTKTQDSFLETIKKYNPLILEKASETAKRCNAILFVNAMSDEGKGYRNLSGNISNPILRPAK